MKVKTMLMILVITFSMSSVTYAADPFLVATSDGEGSDIFKADIETDFIFFDDALNLELAYDILFEPAKYTVKKGDNLFRIALEHSISLESLVEWNNIEGDLIFPGEELHVSDKGIPKTVNKVAAASTVARSSPPPDPVEEPEATVSSSIVEPASSGEEMIVTATAYTAYCEGCSGTTAYGIDLRANPNQKVIAVDPRIIPLGTKVWVEGYGEAIAGDTGGAIKGNKIDVFIPSYDNAIAWGVKEVKIKVIN
ncbi:3D domain-containing protein [Psychrobacillus psychrodurans]|uniref:3D domain-containing protein n=1 Tax=Psychrobacillus psychrodurans TaxID=126157 RepID=UPI0008ED8D37|nr:3D domain-containing protein [Psychrobacillus psychrodurans]SFM97523.1 3D (Asp-Asp-Asp) domain-containing protein [Psychrobacillus psychrodurans]